MTGRMVDKPFLIAASISFFTSMVFYLLLTTMALYTADRFAASDTLAGFSSTAFILGAVVARVLATRMMRAWGRRAVIVTAALMSVILVLLYPFVTEMWQLIAIRLVHGATFGSGSTLLASGVLSRAPQGKRAQVAGYFGLSPTIATAIGPFVAVGVLAAWGMDGIWVASFALTACAAVPALLVRLPDGRVRRGEGMGSASVQPEVAGVSAAHDSDPSGCSKDTTLVPAPTPDRLPRAQLFVLGTVIFLVGFAYAGVIAYLVPYTTMIGAEWSVGVYFLLYALVALAARMMMGKVQDRHGDNVVVYPMLGSFALSLILLGVAQTGWVVAAAGILMGFGFGMVLPTMQAAAAKLVAEPQLNSAVAAVYVSLDFGVGVAPLALGVVIGQLGLSAMYLLLGALVLCAGVIYAFGHGRRAGQGAS